MEIKVRHGVVLVDDADAEKVSGHTWFSAERGNTFYARAWDGGYKTGKMIYMHVLLMGTKGVDHINGNGLDNRRQNLREATNSQNLANQRKTRGTSKYKGVCFNKRNNKWKAAIRKDGKNVHIGEAFGTEQEAAIAYNQKASSLFGEYALLNVI